VHQGELFKEETRSMSDDDLQGSSFLTRNLSVQVHKLFIGAISILVLGVLVYCFGVEQGKRSMEAQLETLLPSRGDLIVPALSAPPKPSVDEESDKGETVLIIGNQELTSKPAEIQLAPETPAKKEDFPVADGARSSDFTVQLVTYENKTLAAKEVNVLREGGHDGFVIPSGRYYQVCADYFNSRSDARFVLNRFKSSGRYPDAYIRPVAR
jgi:hypothetical protein